MAASEPSLCARFEHNAQHHGDVLAARCGVEEVSYRQLNAWANRIAARLLDAEGGRCEPVALLFDKGLVWVAAVLAVLKAGRCFVPLDPAFPQRRLAGIVADTGARLLLTDSANRAAGTRLVGARRVRSLSGEPGSGGDPGNPDVDIAPEDLAWIIYTSGSTGRPKGVTQSHGNVLRYAAEYRACFDIRSSDRLTHLFTTSVNGGAHDLFAALMNGASLHLFDVRKHGLAALAKWLAEEAITIYCSAPTVFRHLALALSGEERLPRIRLVRLIGEPVYAGHVELFRRHFSDRCTLVNRLGSTETGSLLLNFIRRDTPLRGELVPVGFPVEGNEIALLDPCGQPVAKGEVGEIVVRSRHLSPGYWRRADLNAQAFETLGPGGDRRYRTGDLGRVEADGSIVHLGRTDFQIKVRGFRVEIAEIEAALAALPDVADAVVLPSRDAAEEGVDAYLVAADRPPPIETDLRRRLGAMLPEHMVPRRFFLLESLPQAPNGKVDRSALSPALATRAHALQSQTAPPRDALEALIAALWANVLGVDRVGIHERFLELGGDSLRANQLMVRLRDALELDLPWSTLLRQATVADMAQAVRAHGATPVDDETLERLLEDIERSGR